MKQLRIILIPLVLAYLTVLAGYVGFQRKLIYFPTKLDGTTPKNHSLKYHDVAFLSPDGITLTGWWIEHPGKDPNRPVLLYCHGNAANLSKLAEVSRIFYDFGFDELLVDYRSYGASQKAPLSEKALEADALAAYQWLMDKGIPADRIIIWGHSLGSAVAANLAAKVKPAGLILEGPFPSVHAVARDKYPWLLIPSFLVWDKFETEKHVKERTCPVLVFHAEKDTIIPIELGRRVFEKAAEPKQWITVKGIDHNDFPSVAYEYKKPIMDFVKECLKK